MAATFCSQTARPVPVRACASGDRPLIKVRRFNGVICPFATLAAATAPQAHAVAYARHQRWDASAALPQTPSLPPAPGNR